MNSNTSVSQQTQNAIDQNKIQQFMNKAIGDIAGSSTAMLVIIGHRLGLYRAMAQANRPVSVKELADKTGTVERLVSEWLANQVASGYIEYDPSSRKYRLPPEHALTVDTVTSFLSIRSLCFCKKPVICLRGHFESFLDCFTNLIHCSSNFPFTRTSLKNRLSHI
jgi:hypothetical protein